MRATIKVQMDNAAFADDDGKPNVDAAAAQLAIILEGLAGKLTSGATEDRSLIDTNGNRVGEFRIIGRGNK